MEPIVAPTRNGTCSHHSESTIRILRERSKLDNQNAKEVSNKNARDGTQSMDRKKRDDPKMGKGKWNNKRKGKDGKEKVENATYHRREEKGTKTEAGRRRGPQLRIPATKKRKSKGNE